MATENEVTSPLTGEVLDLSKLTDRQLAEAAYRQTNELLGATLDLVKAVGALQVTAEEVRDGVQGKPKDPNAPSLTDEIEEFKATIVKLVGAVEAVPADTAQKVDGVIEQTMIRVVTGAEAATIQ
jgi:hypothetical protein